MKLLHLTLIGLTLLAVAVLGQSGSSAQGPKDTEKKTAALDATKVAQGNNAFAFDLYRRLSQKEGNLIFSPYSVSTALAMTYAGARGETAEQMARVLHFPVSQERLHPAIANLVRYVQAAGKSGGELQVANALWGQKGYHFGREFQNLLQEHYGAGLRELDFMADPESARQTINHWVEQQTHKKIRDLLSDNVLHSQTRLILTNAIYFQAAWHSPFKKENTRDEVFKVSLKKEEKVPMMYQEGFFPYWDLGDAQMLDLPYKGGMLSMVVMLPLKVDGLAELEKSLTAKKFEAWRSRVSLPRKVEVTVPQFKVTKGYSLRKELEGLGMSLPFSGQADFSGMVAGERDRLTIHDTIHKAHVEVNEEGTKAAAATAVVFNRTLSGPGVELADPVSFRADHPFVYLIRDNLTGSILFLGRVVNPKR